jgi:hypothetical protein
MEWARDPGHHCTYYGQITNCMLLRAYCTNTVRYVYTPFSPSLCTICVLYTNHTIENGYITVGDNATPYMYVVIYEVFR